MKINILVLFLCLALTGCAITNGQNHNWEYKVTTISYLNDDDKEIFKRFPFNQFDE